MSTKTQVVTIGTKPMAAILAQWKAEAEAMNDTISPTGAGWLTKKEIRAALGFGMCKADNFVRGRITAGRCEVFHGSARNKAGHASPQIWYRLKG